MAKSSTNGGFSWIFQQAICDFHVRVSGDAPSHVVAGKVRMTEMPGESRRRLSHVFVGPKLVDTTYAKY
jgi:hypothetical protein